ncbi:MAG TPA: hypothetical protein VD902_08275 [Symbiobacteriaceae bacterium]|nr:hypothetical protein [Symbiobacteriaceae bacterium]
METKERRERLAELLELLQEEAEGELSSAEVKQLAKELKRIGGRRKVPALLESDMVKGLLWGAGLAALAFLLMPQMRKSLRPLAVAAAGGVMELVENSKELFESARDGFEDLVAEAHFKRTQAQAEAHEDAVEPEMEEVAGRA